MQEVLKYVTGIDVAKKELVVCLGKVYADLTIELCAHKTFINDAKGFDALVLWARKYAGEQGLVRYVMEATGVYHEPLAYFLDGRSYEVSIIMPNKISNYMRTLDIKTITDKTASEAIARFGLERKLDLWKKPKEVYKKLKQLVRERDQIVVERTAIKNQLHAEESEAWPNERTIERLKERITILDKQEKEVNRDMDDFASKDTEAKGSVKLLCSIPGVGKLTAITVLAETNGFDQIRNRRQLASYAGFDIKEKQSGTSVRGKARISKRGNKYLRKAMFLPAMAAIRTDERARAIFTRLVSKHGIKMKAAVAVQRKLLEMCFTIFKTKTKYDNAYLQTQTINTELTPEQQMANP